MSASVPAQDPFDALGDPNRRAILDLLGAGERSVQELADALPISRPAVSRHLRLLKTAGWSSKSRREPGGSTACTTGAWKRSRSTSSECGRDGGPLPRHGREPRRRGRCVIEPIRLTFEVACPRDRAFEVWTARIAMWWPADHTASGHDDLTVVLEGGLGGRIFERTADGAEHDWGEVTVWEPPARLGYLWRLRRDREDATEVDIRFLDAGIDRTRIEIEHRGWERLGAEAELWRDRNSPGLVDATSPLHGSGPLETPSS